MEDKLSIRVNVADRYYPLKIDRDDEERIRKAARLINEKVFQYKQKYADKDNQDFLAMAALQFVLRLMDLENRVQDLSVWQELEKLDKELDDYLSKE
ncbi:MAG: cell division protein ZapA [Bacteroidales bacterium]|jgi:cell division protein ZapA|nr:cell division protein ZapA [Bacteroidales bacterium]